MGEETDNVMITDESFIPDIPSTVEIPEMENPDDREYETVEVECEGGL